MANFPWISLVTGLIGALVGAVSNAYLHNRRERRAARSELVGLIGTFTEDCMAAVTELHAAIINGEAPERLKRIAEYERLYGRGMSLQIRIFQEFRKRKVRAGFNKVLTRLEEFKTLVDGATPVDDGTFRIAQQWTRQVLSFTIKEAGKEASIPMADPARLHFHGFKKPSREDVQALSFDDEPPPWKYHLSLDLKDMSEDDKIECRKHHDKRIGKMLCKKHRLPAHVYLYGRMDNFSVEISACCEDFSTQVNSALKSSSQGAK